MMKPLLLFFGLLSLSLKAQQPAIGSSTILPTSITANSFVKIATKVTTPSQGVLVDKTFSVTQNPSVISLKICYGSGILPASQSYVDTFSIGQLPAGVYSLRFKAYMSSANQHCAKIDSNEVVSTLTVNALTSLIQNDVVMPLMVYPNPVKDFLYLHTEGAHFVATIYQPDGKMVKKFSSLGSEKIQVTDLPPGLYYLQIMDEEKSTVIKFLKE
jgi:hypothetical protein